MNSKEVDDQFTQLYSSISMGPRSTAKETAKELDQPGRRCQEAVIYVACQERA